ncbi:unnamed protein product [Rotaria sp. Silwood1]|nr:unnamed protein product [Rotaria sp. Silwood1]CAF3410179.1 unnamed protein product [Rotaria sp. Silwood1]CAF4604128.1 unnamed protein product [Rotaria sp. Silwood1]CAF4604142.1 unnamed protein product [Rotaria sp. Silwood1]CAF4705648.1 unnamed protein product [Rotaria sp. Silwood1]
MANNSNNVWRLFWTLIHEWFCATFIHLYIIHTILAFCNNNQRNNERAIDDIKTSDDTLERLRNITKLFSGKSNEDDEHQQLQKVEKFAPSEKIKNTFQKFEEIGLSNGHLEQENDEDEGPLANGIIRSTRRKTITKEHIPYHEMAEVKDKFEKGLVDVNKPRIEKRLDVRVQTGLTSSKKQAFEQGEFEQEIESHISKTPIETDLVAGLTSSKKQVFEQQQINNEMNMINKTNFIEHDVLAGVATETKAKFENGQISDSPRISTCSDEIASIVGTGLAQAKLSEFLSKIDAEQQNQRSVNRNIDIDAEQGLAIARRDQFASLANSEFKPTEKYIDVTAGLTNIIKEQYIADASKATTTTSKIEIPAVDIESGLTKNRAIVFEKPDETTVKRTVDIENELVERGVAKERVAMFKNLESGASSSITGSSGDTKIRVDENGHVVRESDKSEEIYFEKGQTKQLVEQWKTKQISPERDGIDEHIKHDAEIVQQGKAKNLVQMWKTIDKENTPPLERRGLRPITPPIDNERHILPPDDNEINSQNLNYIDDKANIELGHAKAARERFLQNAEQTNAINKRKTLKQFTPPPESFDINRRKSITPPYDGISITEQYTNNEEIMPIKGQAKSLKNRFIEFEQDARKIETSSSKIKYVPKRFVNTPAPKQLNTASTVDSTKCFGCHKTVYAMEKIEADRKVYHKSCFKCTHCKSILKLGNYTANDGQIYCKPHFLQLFAMKGNYSVGFGLNDYKTRWLPTSSPNNISNS